MKRYLKIIIILIIVGLLIFCLYKKMNKKNKINQVSKENYFFQYDDTWKIEKENVLEVDLVHKKSKATLEIKINELEEEMQYKTSEEIFDAFLYNIQKQNNNYKLLYKEKAKITNQNMDGYKIIFENEENEVAIYLYKQGEKLITFIYEAKYENFDILLDSVINIIYSFNINEKKFDVKTYIDLETKEVEFTDQPEVSNLLNDSKDYQILDKNYLVDYSIPGKFKPTDYNSKKGYYKMEITKEKSIELKTWISSISLYEYLDKEKSRKYL